MEWVITGGPCVVSGEVGMGWTHKWPFHFYLFTQFAGVGVVLPSGSGQATFQCAWPLWKWAVEMVAYLNYVGKLIKRIKRFRVLLRPTDAARVTQPFEHEVTWSLDFQKFLFNYMYFAPRNPAMLRLTPLDWTVVVMVSLFNRFTSLSPATLGLVSSLISDLPLSRWGWGWVGNRGML